MVLLGPTGAGKTTLLNRLRGYQLQRESVTTGISNVDALPFDVPGAVTAAFELRYPGPSIPPALREVPVVVALVMVDPRHPDIEQTARECRTLLRAFDPSHLVAQYLVASQVDANRGLMRADAGRLQEISRRSGFDGGFSTSAVTGDGINELRSSIVRSVLAHQHEADPTEVEVIVRAFAEALCELIAKEPGRLDQVEWRDIERVVSIALRGIGFRVTLTPSAKDGGKDVVAVCTVENAIARFYVEIKHWRHDRTGMGFISDFVEVNLRDGTTGGLFLSTSGFTHEVHGRLAEISRDRVRLGDREKIVSLCQRFVRHRGGLWNSETPLPEILVEGTLE